MVRPLANANANALISAAVEHENKLALHSVPNMSELSTRANPAFAKFLQAYESVIPKDKFAMMKKLIKYPLYTTTITAAIYDQLSRVFDAKNAVTDFSFRKAESLEDWLIYREEVLDEPNIWRHRGFELMKTSINSLVVVDMPAEARKPATPYFYWVDISNVKELELDGDTVLSVSFQQVATNAQKPTDKYIRIDKDAYYTYEDLTKEPTSRAEHTLGYCPVTFFWSTPVDERTPALKASPITKELGKLEKFLFNYTAADYLDLYASYPIVSKWEDHCDYREEHTDYVVVCEGGKLKTDKGAFLQDSLGGTKSCPACGGSSLAGPGSVIVVPLPSSGGMADDSDGFSLPGVTITTVDTASLDYNQKKLEKAENSIIASVAGVGGQDSKEAINELQVKSKFEDKLSVLRSLKVNFEKVQKFVDDTICRLRYGDDFIGSTIDYGSEFYLETLTELYDKMAEAKKAGLSEFALDAIAEQILETEYKNNPSMLERLKLLRQIEPYRNLSRDEVLNLSDKLDEELVMIKLQLPNLIDRFENENINITEFGGDVPLQTRIDNIIKTLKGYVRKADLPTE